MRELPSPYYPQWSHSNEHDAFTRDQVLDIQRQAYEDGLRDAANYLESVHPTRLDKFATAIRNLLEPTK